MKKWFFKFFLEKNSYIISKLNDNFSEDFFEVLHISVGQKIKILDNRLDFLTKTKKFLVSKNEKMIFFIFFRKKT